MKSHLDKSAAQVFVAELSRMGAVVSMDPDGEIAANYDALDRIATGEAKLSSLDGQLGEDEVIAAPFTAEAPPLTSSSGVFTPPRPDEAPLELDVPAAEGTGTRHRRATAEIAPMHLPASPPAPAPAPPMARVSGPQVPVLHAPAAPPRRSLGDWIMLGRERLASRSGAGLAIGCLLALALGYVPAGIYASRAEKDQYHAIRHQVALAQSGRLTLAEWEQLPVARAEAANQLDRARRHIQGITFLLWALATGGLAWVWFARVTPALAPWMLPPARPRDAS